MSVLLTVAGGVVLAGAVIMLLAIQRLQRVFSTLQLVLEPARHWVQRRVRVHQAMMIAFTLLYVLMGFSFLVGWTEWSTPTLTAVLLGAGAVFVWMTVTNQQRMVAEMTHTLQHLLPICSSCKSVREGDGDAESWSTLETFVSAQAKVKVSHGICPTCAKDLYGDLADEVAADG